MGVLTEVGRSTQDRLAALGDFCAFGLKTISSPIVHGPMQRRDLRLLAPQLYEVGTRSVPVVMVTGLFVGMVLAVQTVPQFAGIGLLARVGAVVNHSVLKELGPVLAGILLAGRIGGGLTAELGTMHVTEQIDALRAMGCDPIRVLVVPRFLACILLIPLLVLYANFVGILGGYLVSVHIYGVSGVDFWRYSQGTVGLYDLFYGPIKSVFFGAAMSLICCYKGFRCAPGAAGVGRACNESFVVSCMAVLGLDLFLGMLLNTIYLVLYGWKQVL